MLSTVYFVKNNRFVGVGHGFVAWGNVNGPSLLEVMEQSLSDAQSYHKELKRDRWMKCDLVWKDQMSKWFTTEEDLASFDYAIVFDYKIPRAWFQEMEKEDLTFQLINERRQAGRLQDMPADEFEGLLAALQLQPGK